jgi:hypothetical protein
MAKRAKISPNPVSRKIFDRMFEDIRVSMRSDRFRAANQLQPTFPKIKWDGMDWELAELLETAWKQGKITADNFQDVLKTVTPHFINRHGKEFSAKSLAQNLTNKRAREDGRK